MLAGIQYFLASWWKRLIAIPFVGIFSFISLGILFSNFLGISGNDPFFIESLLALAIVLFLTFIIESLRKRSNLSLAGFNLDRYTTKHLIEGFFIVVAIIITTLVFLASFGSEFSINHEVDPEFLLENFLLILFAASFEEILFRGIIMQTLIERYNPYLITILISLGFAYAHIDNPNLNEIGLINIFLAGVLLNLMYIKTRSLWLPISFHFFWNYFLNLLLDSPVSGIDFGQNLIHTDYEQMPVWLFGGDFGLEGGLLASIFLLASISLSHQ